MRFLFSLMLATTSVAGLSSAGAAQATTPQAAKSNPTNQSQLSVDRWMTKPTPIVLTVAQQKSFDSVRTKYVDEATKMKTDAKATNDMSVVMKMREVDLRYQKQVRAILTTEQQAVFDKNIKASGMGT